MGSIDIPPFLREKQKQKVQAGATGSIPPFLKKKEDEIVSETTTEDLPTGTEDISIQQSDLVTESPFDFKRQIPRTLPMQANLKRAEEKVSDINRKVVMGEISSKEIQDLAEDPYQMGLADNIVKAYGGKSFDEVAKNINTQNRKTGVELRDKAVAGIDETIGNILSSYKGTSVFVSGGTGGAAASTNTQNLPSIDINNSSEYGKVLDQLKNIQYLSNSEGGVVAGKKEELIEALNNKLFYLKSKEPISEQINNLSPKIGTAITRINMGRERGENIDIETFATQDKINEDHFKAGLNYIRDANPGKYKNIIRAIENKEQIADTDFEQLADIGEQVVNFQVYRGAATDPNLIDKETNIGYIGTSYQSKKSDAALRIGEYLKGKRITAKEYSAKEIRDAANKVGIKNPEIVNDLVFEEGLPMYDAIPKSGTIEAFVRGLQTPLSAIQKTIDVVEGDASTTYLRSQQLDVGIAQKVKDKKGQITGELPSERGNVWYDAIEGFGQFIPQVILAKGIGGAVSGEINLVSRTGLTAAQTANVTNYAGTAISTYLQEYGSSYEDALQKTGDPATAKAMGAINGISAAAFELILPDVKIADAASKLMRGKYATDIVDFIKKGGNPAELAKKGRPIIQKFVTETLDIARQEVAEEVGTNLENYLTEAIFSPKTVNDRDLANELYETAKATAITMIIPSVLGAGGAAMSKDFTVNGLNSAAINIKESQAALNRALIDDNISQDQYDKALVLLKTHKNSITTSPESDISGKELSTKERLDYAYQETQIKINEKKSENIKGVQKEILENKIKQAEDIQREILIPKEKVVEEDNFIAESADNVVMVGEDGIIRPVELTPEETAAIDVIKGKEFTVLKPYTDVIKDENSSVEDKKDALKGISDQLLADGTNELVGSELGRSGSEVIENLGFEAPQESEALKNITQPKTQTNETTQTQTTPEAETSVLTETKTTAEPPVSSVEGGEVVDNTALKDAEVAKKFHSQVRDEWRKQNLEISGKEKVDKQNEAAGGKKLSDEYKQWMAEKKRIRDSLGEIETLLSKGDLQGAYDLAKKDGSYPKLVEAVDKGSVEDYEKNKKETDVIDRINKLNAGSNTWDVSLKEAMLDNPQKAKIAFELRDLAEKVWGMKLGDDLSSLSMFFYGEANSAKEFLDGQIKDANVSIDRIEKQIDALGKSKSDQRIKSNYEEEIKTLKGNIEKYKKAEQSLPKGEAAKQPIAKNEKETTPISDTPKNQSADIGTSEKTGEATSEGKTTAQKGKELADKIRGLKSKRDTLQANIFGIPIAIYDGALEVVATAIEAGAELAQAIQDGIKYIRDKGGNDLDEAAFTSHINDVSEGVKPKVKVQVGEPEGTKKDNKAVIGRLMKSENVPDEVKEIFKENDLKYKVRSQAEARKIGNAVIESFGIDEAVLLAEAGKFHGDVNSMIFALSLDRMYEAEQAATTPEAKQEAAEQYADIAMRYQDAAESGGRFISAINDFYKKSPAGLVIKAEKEFQRRQDEYFEGREKPTKEAWQEFINTVEGKELLQEELEKIKPKKKKIFTPDTEAKIKNFFSKLKINTKGQAGSYLIPPQIYNAAIDVIENAVLAGVSIGKAIEQAVEYIGDNYKEAWKVKEFKKDIRDGFKKQNVQRVLSTEDRENILKKWNKKLIGLNQEQKNTLLNKAFLELIDNGALEYDQFKQLYAEALGLPQMTPELAAQLKELATKINEPSKIKDEILKTKSPELISKYRDAVKDAEIAATKLNDLIGKQKWWLNTFLTVMRLNTLGAVSLVGNIAYNVAALPVRFAVNLTATGIDYLLAGAQLTSDKVFGTSLYTNPPTHNVFKIQGGFLRGLWLGTTTSIKQFFTGLSNRDYFQKEIKQNIKPFTSAKKFIRGMTGKQKLTLNEKLNSFIEAFPTMGMSAEVIARALNIGDKGFRFAAEYAKAEQLGQQKGLKGIDKEIFILFPDEESEQKIRDAGEKIVFQQKNVVTKALDSAGTAISHSVKKQGGEYKLLHGIAKTLGYASQPFLNTPLNVFNEFIHYAFPPLPLYRAGKAMVQGDSEKAVYHLSQAVVGLSIGYAATQLVAQGLITGSGDDDEAKERAGIQAFQRQGQINLSGLKRLLAGSYDGVEDDDTWVDLKYYGFMGMLLLSKASQYKGKTKEQIEGETYFQDVVGQFVPAVKTGLTAGVFSGTSSLMNAISMGGRYTDNWILGMGNVFVNAFEPTWLRSLSNSNNDYIRDTRDMSLSQEAKNQLKNRFFSGKDLPSKIDIWGERIESVPVGSNRYMYNIMGLNKKNIFDNDQFGYALYDYYNQTKNYNVFPPVLKREVNNQALTPEQYEQFSILVGSHRRQLINPLIQSGKFEKLKGEGVESVTKELDKKYDEARKLGVKEFENIYPEFKLKKKK